MMKGQQAYELRASLTVESGKMGFNVQLKVLGLGIGQICLQILK